MLILRNFLIQLYYSWFNVSFIFFSIYATNTYLRTLYHLPINICSLKKAILSAIKKIVNDNLYGVQS